ncbi:MAG TPA: phosphatidylinositol kinase [Acidimicrobiia bacterium]|nr:phosphatidylinositol kinase [Acidimicrobiia bacterium]
MNVIELTEIEGQMPYASNATLLGRDSQGRLWVYKPERGESPLWDFPLRSLANREILTYEVSQALDLDLVPETRAAEGPLGPGSAQAFVTEDFDFDPRTLLVPALDSRLWPVAVLDIVCNNADRKLGHIIAEIGTGRLWAIDHGLTFHTEPKLRTVLWGLAGQPLPSPLLEAVARLSTALTDHLWQRTAELLSPAEADALAQRVGGLLAQPVHPPPPQDRPALPWPLW